MEIPRFHPRTLQEYLGTLYADSQLVVAQVSFVDDGCCIAQSLSQHECRAGSDGSYKEGTATALLVFEGLTSRHRFRSDVRAPGATPSQDAYQGVLAGLYATVVLIEILARNCQIWHGLSECSNSMF